ncbi:MAG: ATP-grasp domain-containing protein [Chloroherpetonaceae bacterium]|nr:ATP-grasp domain-containing protein [Chloroherpetonaceae bacterium]MDW8019970.1 ATP-grasp domain-containing protein [Chloroherpetonaceae bacterium]
MSQSTPLNLLCLASYEKGQAFLREAKRQGCNVYLLTSKSLENVDWGRENLADIFYIPDVNKEWNKHDVLMGVSYLARTLQIDKIVALDDYDVEMAAMLREHLRVPGMGETTARYFRDKLAMRVKAQQDGIPVPDFIHVLNYDKMRDFMRRVPPPWLVKPRSAASSLGIKKAHSEAELWQIVEQLGDRQSFYVMERFVPGDVYHVDSIILNRQVMFAIASKYAVPPMQVMHQGAVFSTRTLPDDSPDAQTLLALNARVIASMGHILGVSHTEFIKGEDGTFYFLETSARVGGAHIVELIEAATGINLWEEWAKVEIRPDTYQLPPLRREHSGLLISLARQQTPDLSAYNDPEIYWRLSKEHHAGLIVRSPSYERITQLLEQYTARFYQDFFATQPPPEKPVH